MKSALRLMTCLMTILIMLSGCTTDASYRPVRVDGLNYAGKNVAFVWADRNEDGHIQFHRLNGRITKQHSAMSTAQALAVPAGSHELDMEYWNYAGGWTASNSALDFRLIVEAGRTYVVRFDIIKSSYLGGQIRYWLEELPPGHDCSYIQRARQGFYVAYQLSCGARTSSK